MKSADTKLLQSTLSYAPDYANQGERWLVGEPMPNGRQPNGQDKRELAEQLNYAASVVERLGGPREQDMANGWRRIASSLTTAVPSDAEMERRLKDVTGMEFKQPPPVLVSQRLPYIHRRRRLTKRPSAGGTR